jgi:hypothetical protein
MTALTSSTNVLSQIETVTITQFILIFKLYCIEFMKILQACAMGFLVIGFIGYIIKLVFIPINNIILGA